MMLSLLDIMNNAIECNNTAVALMDKGDISAAVETFKSATQLMHIVSQSLQANVQHIPITCTRSSHVLMGMSFLEFAKQKLAQTPDVKPTLTNKSRLAPDLGFSSSQAVKMSLYSEMPLSCTHEASVILFNKALSYHLGQGDEPAMLNALYLYEMSFGLAYMVPEDERMHRIVMASLSNSGFLYHALGHYDESIKNLAMLSGFLHLLPETTDSTAQQERQYYRMTTVLLETPVLAGAA